MECIPRREGSGANHVVRSHSVIVVIDYTGFRKCMCEADGHIRGAFFQSVTHATAREESRSNDVCIRRVDVSCGSPMFADVAYEQFRLFFAEPSMTKSVQHVDPRSNWIIG